MVTAKIISFSFFLFASLLSMAESRTELIAWINDLLQTRLTKLEQAGTGTNKQTK
jgi:hypothetical protein